MNQVKTNLKNIFLFIPLLQYLSDFQVKDYSSLILGLSKTSNCSKIEEKINVAAVITPQAKAKGLSERPEPLKKNEGMLFVYQPAQEATFWMKNTLIPLSIGFFDTAGKLVKTYEMPVEKKPAEPEHWYPSNTVTPFALEMNFKKISNSQLRQFLCVEKK